MVASLMGVIVNICDTREVMLHIGKYNLTIIDFPKNNITL